MPTALAASVTDLLLGLALGSGDSGTGNRVTVDGVSLTPDQDGTLAIAIGRLEAAAFEVRSGPLQWKVGHLAVHRATARVGSVAGKPHLLAFAADDAELSGVELRGPVVVAEPSVHRPSHFSLAPLAGAEGTIEAEIVDAHLVFDAQVKVPIRHGGIAFGDATVEHVGPDSRMGVSRMGIYVDAPNGRSYLFQFSSPPVAGVEYERRGAMLGPWVTDRGKLQLQPFAEWLLRQPAAAKGHGFTEQARLLFERTALSGSVQLGDGTLAVRGVRGEMAGRAQGHNGVRLQAEAVGRGVTLEMPSLSIRNAALEVGAAAVQCDAVAGALTLQLALEGKELRFVLSLPNMKLSGLRLALPRTSPP